MRSLVVAGTASGVGKTTLTLGIIAALRRRGLVVQPFKVGPDYIDPGYHTLAAGRPSRNLDAWMVPEDAVRALYARAAVDADVAIVEGVMGLFDGRTGEGDVGSTAHVARLLGAPVVLVLDAAKVARSIAATVLGFVRFDPDTRIVGCILNNAASDRHADLLRDAVEREAGVPVLGTLRRDAAPRLEERYLGLVPTAERTLPDDYLDPLADAVERGIDLDRLLSLAAPAHETHAHHHDMAGASTVGTPSTTAVSTTSSPAAGTSSPADLPLFPLEPASVRARIGVARDAAFNFYYEDNLDLLRAWGAEIVPFSPLDDRALPPDLGGLYFGGGFPELFAERLAANRSMLATVRDAVTSGMPIVAECGGLMYLGRTITDRDGRAYQMVGLIDADSSLSKGRLTLGYREIEALRDSPLLRAGERVRGHEFHWSSAGVVAPAGAAYQLDGATSSIEGFASTTLLASYIHLHFATNPRLAPRFVAAAATLTQAGIEVNGVRHFDPVDARQHDGIDAPIRCGGDGSAVTNRVILRQAEPAERISSPDRPARVSPRVLRFAQDDTSAPNEEPARDGESAHGDAGHGPPLSLLQRHGYGPRETERLSMRRIEERFGDRLPNAEAERALVSRLVYAAGDPSLIDMIRCSKGAIEAATGALGRGARLIVDARMVAAGLSGADLAALGVEPTVAIDQPLAGEIAAREGITRSAAGILALGSKLDGALVAIGNAPTALLALLDLAQAGIARPAAVIGVPVGFVAAAESKEELARSRLPHVTILGSRGGSALAAAAVNLLARRALAQSQVGTC